MGGHQCGEVASRLAVDIISQKIVDHADELIPSSNCTLGQLRELASDYVVEWVKDANTQIFQKGTELSVAGEKRMGTTLVMTVLVESYVILTHVGDSRIYRMREKRFRQMTEDHVTVARRNKPPGPDGKIRVKKYVTRALGTFPVVDPDVRVELVEDGDIFLLCSDGLTDLVKDKEIERILRRAGDDLQIAVRSLIHLANKRGGTDNITVVIGEVWDVDDDDEDTEDLSALMPRRK